MSNTIVDKIKDVFNFGVEDVEDEEVLDSEYEDAEELDEGVSRLWNRKSSKAVTSAPTKSVKMKIFQPTAFEEYNDMLDLIKERQAIIINLEYVSKDIGRRIVDIVYGAAKALDGDMHKVSNSIFLVSPAQYEVAEDIEKDEVKAKLTPSFLNKFSNGQN